MKKLLILAGFHSVQKFFNRETDKEITDLDKKFIGIWKEKVHERKNELYKTKEEYFDVHMVLDNTNKIYLKMISDRDKSVIELTYIDNGKIIHQCVVLPESIKNRLIDSFDAEIKNRCNSIDKELKTTVIDEISKL